MKTLIVKYLPSGDHSNTRKLLDVFVNELGDRPVETVDLLETPAPQFTVESMAAYGKRNYGGKSLSTEEAATLEQQDRLTRQLKSADVVVMAYPMHNFGMPGPVKTWLDAVMLNGETFEMGKKLMAGRKSLTLYTSGGVYPADHAGPEYPHWDTLSVLAKIDFGFMGYDEAEVVSASLRDPSKAEQNLGEVRQKVRGLVQKWYR